MSSGNVDLVRGGIEAFSRKDVDALNEMSSEDVEITPASGEDIERDTLRGEDAWSAYFERMDGLWEEWRVEDPELFDAGDAGVVATFRIAGREKESGDEAEHTIGVTFLLDDGKITRVRGYLEPRDALLAAGLRET